MCTVELGLEDGGIEGCGAFRIAEEQHHYIVTQVPLPLHLPHPSVPKAHTHTQHRGSAVTVIKVSVPAVGRWDGKGSWGPHET
jgi:hypothetical protein